jgi:hypothetical protein
MDSLNCEEEISELQTILKAIIIDDEAAAGRLYKLH